MSGLLMCFRGLLLRLIGGKLTGGWRSNGGDIEMGKAERDEVARLIFLMDRVLAEIRAFEAEVRAEDEVEELRKLLALARVQIEWLRRGLGGGGEGEAS